MIPALSAAPGPVTHPLHPATTSVAVRSVARQLAPRSLASEKASERPNFLLVITDDQRWDALSVVQGERGARGRFPWIRTPNMDRLAAEGARFRNAFVTESLCSPSRACILTGKYNHLNGIANNHTPFPLTETTCASLLRSAGYRTGYVGKWHMGNQRDRPGFDYAASFIGQGRYTDCPFVVNGKDTPTSGWVDDMSAGFAVDFLKQGQLPENRKKPFLLVVGFKSPHEPWSPPERLKSLYDGENARPAPNAGSRAPYLPPVHDAAPLPADRLSPGASPERLRNYFRVIHGADEDLGILLRTLDDLKLSSNTVVVFTSDNGYYLGEHGLGDKRSAYEESMRVPMILRYPGRIKPGRKIDQPVLNVDLAPTFLDLAGVRVPREMQGTSWKPLIREEKVAWRTSWFYEYFRERGFGTPMVLADRTGAWKLIEYPGHPEWTELYNIPLDPFETNNVARDAAYAPALKRIETDFAVQKRRVAFRIPAYADPQDGSPASSIRRGSGLVLDYTFAQDAGGRVVDRSNSQLSTSAGSAPLVTGPEGRKARRFGATGAINVPRSPLLNPAGGPWTVEVDVRSESADGVILARGGASQGYSLFLERGVPVFAVTVDGQVTRAAGRAPITGRWVLLTGVITAKRQAELFVDGELSASVPLPGFIAQDPNDGMQIGADLGSRVVRYAHPAGFTGYIARVRLFGGERSAQEIGSDAAR